MNFDFQTITNAIGWALVHFLWQGLAIVLGTAFLLQIFHSARAQTRYLIACLSLVACFFMPIWEMLRSIQTTAEFTGAQLIPTGSVEATAVLSWPDQAQIWLQQHIDLIVIIWATMVAMLGLRLLLGIFWLRSYSNGERGVSNSYWQQKTDQLAEHFQIAKPVLVRVVEELDSPITIGWIRPMILLPASLVTGMTPSYLEALIAHELAHIARFDYLVNFIQNLIEMVLFFHPAVWWISKRIRIERENIADDLAASMLGEPRRLALALQELEYIQFTNPQLAQAAHGGNLMLRIKRLVRPEAQSISWKTAVTVFGIGAACLGLAANANLAPTQTTKPHQVASSKEFKGRVNFLNHGCTPEYPKESLATKETGVTRLKVFMATDGSVEKVDVLKSSGWPNLDNAVKGKLLAGQCKGTIVKFKGVPQATVSLIDYVWKLY